MIAIVGQPILAIDGAGPRPIGMTAAIATTAAAAGGSVQVIGKVGEDPDGDAILLALAQAGIGHVATLRDPAHRTPVVRVARTAALTAGAEALTAGAEAALPVGLLDGDGTDDDDLDPWSFAPASIEPGDPGDRPGLDIADVELALRYLPDIRVVVVVEPVDGLSAATSAEAVAAGAHLVVILAAGAARTREVDDLPGDALVLAAPDGPDVRTFATLVGRYAALIDAGTKPDRAFETVLGARSG